jgi:hypothetical protein
MLDYEDHNMTAILNNVFSFFRLNLSEKLCVSAMRCKEREHSYQLGPNRYAVYLAE